MADYSSALIQSLRGSGDFGTNNPGVSFLDNPTNAFAPINFRRAPRVGMTNRPEVLQMPVYTPQPSFGGGGDGGAPFVRDRGLNFDLPLMEELSVEPDPVEIGPAEESVAESFPVPEPGRIYSEELPPLEPVAQPFPVPDPPEMEFFDLPPLPDEPPAQPPEYDEIPEGQIEIEPLGGFQRARDALDGIGDITDLGSPIDEWEPIDLPIPEIPLPPIPEPDPAPEPTSGGGGGGGDYYVRPSISYSVSPDPLDEWEWIDLPEPEIPLPEIPAPSASYTFSDADMMDMLLNDYSLMSL